MNSVMSLVVSRRCVLDMIEAYIDPKRENEVLPLKLRPNPCRFYLYGGL